MITVLIADIVAETRRRLAALAPEGPEDIRGAGAPTVAFSTSIGAQIIGLKVFLSERVYRSRRVLRVMQDAEAIVGDLFRRYVGAPCDLPDSWRAAAEAANSERRRARVIGDFVAGMTDRYAMAEHRRLFDATPELR
jgi:dGTPase